MAKIYSVTIKRACSANNTQLGVDVTVDDNINVPTNKDDRNVFFKSVVLSQHPNISHPCKLGEFNVLFVNEKGSTKEIKSTTSTSSRKPVQKSNRPIWLSLLLFPFKIIGWLFNNLFWKQLK